MVGESRQLVPSAGLRLRLLRLWSPPSKCSSRPPAQRRAPPASAMCDPPILFGNSWPPVSTHAFQPLVSLVRLAYFFLACNSCKHFVMSHDICQDVEDRNKTICANSNSKTKSFGAKRVALVLRLLSTFCISDYRIIPPTF